MGKIFDRQAAQRPPRGKQKGGVQVETLAVFATTRVSEEQVPVLPVPMQNQSGGHARIASKEPARIHRVICDTLPCVRILDHRQAANSAKGVRSCTMKPTDSQRKQRRVEEKYLWPLFDM